MLWILLDQKTLNEFYNLDSVNANFPIFRKKSQSLHIQKNDSSSNIKFEVKPIKLFDMQMKEKMDINNPYDFKPSFKILKNKHKKMIEKIENKLIFLTNGIKEIKLCGGAFDKISKIKEKPKIINDINVFINKINWLYLNKFLNFDNFKRIKGFKEDVFILYLIENLRKKGIFLEKDKKIIMNALLNSLSRLQFQRKELETMKNTILNYKFVNDEDFSVSQNLKNQTFNFNMKINLSPNEIEKVLHNSSNNDFFSKKNQMVKKNELYNLKSVNSEEKFLMQSLASLENQASNTTEVTFVKNSEIKKNNSNSIISSKYKRCNSLNSIKSTTDFKRSNSER